MASINDVFNRLGATNDTLGWIYKSILAGTAETTTVNTSVNKLDNDVKAGTTATVNAVNNLDNDVKAGTAALVNMLTIIAEIQVAAVDLLYHITQQNDTMICELGQISKNTCGILTQTTIQTHLQKGIREDTGAILNIDEAVHPEASLNLVRLAELRAKIEKCCPPPQPPPACTYEPCPAPKTIAMPQLPPIPQPNNPPGTNNPTGGKIS